MSRSDLGPTATQKIKGRDPSQLLTKRQPSHFYQ